jgi:hypothetical protein
MRWRRDWPKSFIGPNTYRRLDRRGGCNKLYIQREQKLPYYVVHRFAASRNYLAGGVGLQPCVCATLKFVRNGLNQPAWLDIS